MRGKTIPQIGIDLMGSDTAPENLLQGIVDLALELKDAAQIYVFGTESVFQHQKLLHIVPILVKDVVYMEDNPLTAVRHKKDSSMCIGMQMLQRKELDVFISGGNTGALIASAKLHLPKLPHIRRPALMTLLPTKKKELAVLDVGANVEVKSEHLVQFASMGIAFQKCRGISQPKVGLLNIGTEEQKGTPLLREAYKKLQLFNKGKEGSFAGNVEGRDVFNGDIDVLVTDGFTGNIFLKTAEGIAAHVLDILKASQTIGELSKLKARLHYTEYPGAILCGVEGIVMKCHGSLSMQTIILSVKAGISLVEHGFLEKLKDQLELVHRRFSLSSIKKRLLNK